MYNPYISGKQVYLRHPIEEDVDGKWHEWFSDQDVTRYLNDRFWPNSREGQLAFFKSLFKDKTKLVLSIINKSNDKHIGVVSLSSINWVHSYADIAMVIGEKEYRKGTIGIEAFSLMLEVAFTKLNLRNIKSGYVSKNKESEALHRMMRFNVIGSYKDLVCINGEYMDLTLECLNRKSWSKRNN